MVPLLSLSESIGGQIELEMIDPGRRAVLATIIQQMCS